MQKYQVVDGEDGAMGRQCQDRIVNITGDVKESFRVFCYPLQVDQIEKNVQYATAGEGKIDFIDADIIVGF